MTATLARLVEMVRAEAGHSLAVSQGLNSEETIKQLIRRAEEQLWTAYQWPQLKARWDIDVQEGQTEYQYPAKLQFDQIREVAYSTKNQIQWYSVSFGIPEDAIMPYGAPSQIYQNSRIISWDTYWNTDAEESRIRVFPTPTDVGFLRVIGQGPLKCLIADDDCCTLDPSLIVLYVASRLLTRAKAADAEFVDRALQRHLSKVQARHNSDKQKVSVLGDIRIPNAHRMRYGIDYMNRR